MLKEDHFGRQWYFICTKREVRCVIDSIVNQYGEKLSLALIELHLFDTVQEHRGNYLLWIIFFSDDLYTMRKCTQVSAASVNVLL